MNTNLQELEQHLEYKFNNQTLLLQALTHPSYLHESMNLYGDYQRLEFLGDSVLGLLLAEMLYNRYPDWNEGALSQLRSRLAGQDALADRAQKLRLGDFILLGRGEEHTGGRKKDSILADIFEATLAAIYLDSGLESARFFVLRMFSNLADAPQNLQLGRDSKSELQEYLSAHNYPHPNYHLVEMAGPPHNPTFKFQILTDGRVIGEGEGGSKKNAQQAAAYKALKIVKHEKEPIA